jgi:hypothetical protein
VGDMAGLVGTGFVHGSSVHRLLVGLRVVSTNPGGIY